VRSIPVLRGEKKGDDLYYGAGKKRKGNIGKLSRLRERKVGLTGGNAQSAEGGAYYGNKPTFSILSRENDRLEHQGCGSEGGN